MQQRKRTVVLVEDDPLLVDIYSTKFQEKGFDATVVDHGGKAVEVVQSVGPDVVVLDIVLPEQDGWEILHSLKRIAKLKNTKVIILSNLGQKEEVEKGLKLGAASYLIKAHYTPSQVVDEIEKIMEDS